MSKADIAIVGLSVMGRSLALNMADHQIKVAGYNRSAQVTKDMVIKYPNENFIPFYDLKELVDSLSKPRVVMLMIQAGKSVDQVIDQLITLLDEDDMILDGGNSFFEDTKRRYEYLKKFNIHYFGVGVSGGESGARHGPAIMPGGDFQYYSRIQSMLEAISAKVDGEPCCSYIGNDGAGHYVKMVHNGIEYADMQLIAEAYLLLQGIGLSNEEMADVFHDWQGRELNSYLIQITADILREKDDLQDGDLIDQILSRASQKGTGRWAAIESLKQGIDISMIIAAGNSRVISSSSQRESLIDKTLKLSIDCEDKKAFIEQVYQGLYCAKIIAYAQGFSLLDDANTRYDWNLNFESIASIFRGGCIIQAQFLNDIMKAYQNEENLKHLLMDSFFFEQVKKYESSLRKNIADGVLNRIPLPAMSTALAYLDSLLSPRNGANLIQAQRDYFGAHTYERVDQMGSFHHEWGSFYEYKH